MRSVGAGLGRGLRRESAPPTRHAVESTSVPAAPDPLAPIFSRPTTELFSSQSPVVEHGSLVRFPGFMREGPMESVDALCRHYVGPVEVAGGSVTEGAQLALSDAHPAGLLRLGLTVFFVEMKRALPQSQAFLRALEGALGVPECAALSAFANAPGSGLPIHHDRFDQLLFHVRGEKRFSYLENRFVERPDLAFSPVGPMVPEWGPVYRNGYPVEARELVDQGLVTIDLKPGSALFLPAGTWHTTAEQTSEALSLAVAIRCPSRLELLLLLLRHYAGQSPDWRTTPYGAWGADPAVLARESEAMQGLMNDLGRRLQRLPAADAYDAYKAHGYMSGATVDYPMPNRFQRYLRLPNASATLQDQPDGKLTCTVLSGPSHRPQARTVLGLNAEARVIVEWVLGTRRVFSADELSERFGDFPPDDLSDLLGFLSRSGLVRPLLAPEWGSDP